MSKWVNFPEWDVWKNNTNRRPNKDCGSCRETVTWGVFFRIKIADMIHVIFQCERCYMDSGLYFDLDFKEVKGHGRNT